MKPETSIIIRTKNEEKWLGETLKRLGEQTYKNYEIIIVDSGSTDKTVGIAKKYNLKVVYLKPAEFTYPLAINVGIKNSSASKFYLLLSAHSLPIGDNWLKIGIETLASDALACGLYGPLKAMPDGSLMDYLIHNLSYYREKIKVGKSKFRNLSKYEGGALGFTNAIIRKDLYDECPINETYAGGGEDTVWLKYWQERGYHAIKHLDFAVHHSHYLGLIGWYFQWQNWKKNSLPQPFIPLSFRKDGAHKS